MLGGIHCEDKSVLAETNLRYSLIHAADSAWPCRVIRRIYTVNDPRDPQQKPHANEIILSFWWRYLGRDLRWLQTMLFCDVEEGTLLNARPLVYDAMHRLSWQTLHIHPRGTTERTQFNILYKHTKFGRVARRIATQIEGITQVRTMVVRFTFLPEVAEIDDGDEGDEGDNFHFKIAFGRIQSGR